MLETLDEKVQIYIWKINNQPFPQTFLMKSLKKGHYHKEYLL